MLTSVFDTSVFEEALEHDPTLLQLDVDAKGRAADIQRLLNNGLLIGSCFPIPVVGYVRSSFFIETWYRTCWPFNGRG